MNDDIEEKIKLKKDFIKQQVLNEDEKNNLKQIMKENYTRREKTTKKYKKIIGCVACLFVISTVAFATNIDNIINLFENTQMDSKQIINPNSIIKIDSDYVTDNGVGMNISYLYEESEYLYIVLNVKEIDENIKDIMFDKIEINDLTNNKVYSFEELNNENNFEISVQYKKDHKMIFIKMKKYNELNSIKELEVKIENLTTIGTVDKNISGNWEFKIMRT